MRNVGRKKRYLVMRRDGFKCRICGRSSADGVKLHVDHITPINAGGGNEHDNLMTLCNECNQGKGVLPITEFGHGGSLLPWFDLPDDCELIDSDGLMAFDRHVCNELGVPEFLRKMSRLDRPGADGKPFKMSADEAREKQIEINREWDAQKFNAIHVTRLSENIRVRTPVIGVRLP